MLPLPPSTKIYLATDRVDGRKGIDGLCALVRTHFGSDPLSGHLFVFITRCGDGLRVLYWDRNGYILLLKRLEKGSFRAPIPPAFTSSQLCIEPDELLLLLGGLDLRHAHRRARWTPPQHAHNQST